MPDLEFALPLPPVNGFRELSYSDTCRKRVVEALEQLPPLARRLWPTEEKIRCSIILYDGVRHELSMRGYLGEAINSMAEMLWDKRLSEPLILIEQVMPEIGEQNDPRLQVKIMVRKLIRSNGPGKHYEW